MSGYNNWGVLFLEAAARKVCWEVSIVPRRWMGGSVGGAGFESCLQNMDSAGL
jgi:hypothetical protein